MVFATSAMPCWGKNLIKMVPRAFQKQLSNQHPNLHRFWNQLGLILGRFGGQVGPKLGPNRFTSRSKKWSKKWSPKTSKKGARYAASWGQHGVQTQWDARGMVGYFSVQNSSKIESCFWSLFWSIFDWFFIDFRSQNPPKINKKSINKSPQHHNNKKSKKLILYCILQYNRALGYVMLCAKIIKHRPNIL